VGIVVGKELSNKIEQLQRRYSRTRKELHEQIQLYPYPLAAEPALIHPNNTSVVKLRDNGAIDIFVGNDNGIRVDPNERSIQIFGNALRSKVYEEAIKINKHRTMEIGGDDITNIKGKRKIQCDGRYEAKIRREWKVLSEEMVRIEAPRIDLIGDVTVNGRRVQTY
jgi:hypothetical protein